MKLGIAQLIAIITDRAATPEVQIAAVQRLGEIDSADAERALYEFCQDHSLPADLAASAGANLAMRSGRIPLDEWAKRDFSPSADVAYDIAISRVSAEHVNRRP